jgi:hypothetical protein
MLHVIPTFDDAILHLLQRQFAIPAPSGSTMPQIILGT